jgi:lysophospholipase
MSISGFEERFLEPPGWRWHTFKHQGRSLRFGTASPQNSVPDGVVVCLPGLSEFGEKYFETARDCLNMNLAFWVIDWMGQGKSDRYIRNSQKRHSKGYQRDIDDLHAFIMDYIKHSSVHPDRGRIPLVMLAHSMGGHIGMHYLLQHPGIFECAAFSAPMLRLKAFDGVPDPLAWSIAAFANLFSDTAYIRGFGDWRPEIRTIEKINYYSEDAVRKEIHNAWCLADSSLQVGGVTYGWLYESHKSAMALWKKNRLETVQIHCLMALAGKEHFVSNVAIRKAAAIMPHVKLIEFPDSQHEILVERDEIRKVFLKEFYDLIKDRIIKRPETLKPF